jgi:hypothetical protein
MNRISAKFMNRTSFQTIHYVWWVNGGARMRYGKRDIRLMDWESFALLSGII